MELEHPWILVPAKAPGTSSPWIQIPGDNYILRSQSFHSYNKMILFYVYSMSIDSILFYSMPIVMTFGTTSILTPFRE